MKLLITTQAVDRNDPILGFFHRWLEEFAKHAEEVTVFALRVGEQALPNNVHVMPLRPDGNRNRLRTALRLLSLSWNYRRSYDAVFVHMTMENVLVAGWLWRLLGKRIVLWYTHGTVSLRLRAALPFTHLVCTASAASMRIVTPKKRVMGHGMDIDALPLLPSPRKSELSFLTVGRVSPVKRVDMLIEAIDLLRERDIDATLRVAGDGDPSYINSLRKTGESASFIGPVAHAELPTLYRDTHLFLHASATGSLDKAPLEALALGVPVLTTNQELAEETGCPGVFGTAASAPAFALSLEKLVWEKPWNKDEIRSGARSWVKEHHDLPSLIERLSALLTV